MNDQLEPLLTKEDGEIVTPVHRARGRRELWLLAAVYAGITAVLVCTGFRDLRGLVPQGLGEYKEELVACPSAEAAAVQAPRRNLWKNIDLKEAMEIKAWLSSPERGLNLTNSELAEDKDNFIHLVETYPPPKTDALEYLRDESHQVDRYARAVINEGHKDRIAEYLVGPLPVSNHTKVRQLTEIYHAPVPLNARSTFNFPALARMVGRLMAPIDDIAQDLFNLSIADGSLTISAQMPLSYDGSYRRTWMQLKRNLPGSWLRPTDFYCLVDISGVDDSKNHIMAYVHNGTMYRSTSELRAAWKRGELVRDLDHDDSDWASRSIKGKRRDLDDRAGPRSVLTDGARYRVDTAESYVTWMGWSLYLSFYRDMGLHLWDLRFRGDRVIYELAPQEAMAQYSGSDPHQGSTVWLDRAFGMGSQVRGVILGYDCPHHATLLNATIHEMGSTLRQNAICVYERHAKDEMGAVKGYELVIRSISSVGNYDYMFDYILQLDGTIEVRVSASGYLQGGKWDSAQSPYGHQIQRGTMGSLHDHVINYKIDFDVAGRKNSLTRVKLEQEVLDKPWFELDGWGPVAQTKIVREMVDKETTLDYPPNMEGAYVVTNEDKHNAWGNPRGYALHPGPLCRLANVNAKRTEHSVNWAKHHLAVTRQHENEPSSSSMWNGNLPGRPPVDFDKFFDNESLKQEDLVLWANLGTHHIPRAEDSPNTLTNVATSYLLLVPWNFNDHDVSMESRNSVLLNNDGKWQITESVRQPHCAVPPQPELTYHGLSAWHEDGTPYTPVEIPGLRSHADAIHAFGM